MTSITEQERQRRLAGNADILGTHAMEGLFPDEATQVLLDRFAAGELDREQLSAAIDAHVESLVAAMQHLAGVA